MFRAKIYNVNRYSKNRRKKKKKNFNVQRTIVQKGKKKDKIDFCYC